jgi:hypothetical protein
MNCREFTEQAAEIARTSVMDAAARDAALAHAEACAACAARLASERTLTSALRATAESYAEAAAPARVEAALLAAFRQTRPTLAEAVNDAAETAHEAALPSVVRASQPAPVVPFESVRVLTSRFGRRARVAFAGAAVAASLILAFVVVSRSPQGTRPAEQLADAQPPAASSQTPDARSDARDAAPQPASQNETAAAAAQDESASPLNDGAGSRSDVEAVRRANASAVGEKPARPKMAAGGQSQKKAFGETALAFEIDGGQAVFAEGEPVAAPASAAGEVASLRGDEAALTDFVPLAAGASTAPLDGGQVVRVEAPRAALASLGLPVDARRAGEKVKADLLLAHDGTPQAIRFVR